MRLGLLALTVMTGLGSTSVAEAQASVNLPIGDPVYDYLERLQDLGLCPGLMRSVRPITVAHAAALVREARKLAAQRGTPPPAFMGTLADLIERLEAHDVKHGRVGGGAAVAVGTWREVLERAVYSEVETVGHLDRAAGRLAVEGSEAAFAATGRATFFGVAAAEVAAVFGFPESGASARLRRAYLTLGLGALALEAGRDDIVWGPGRWASLTLSGNAPALDQVAVKTSRPVRLPWFLRHLGRWQTALFVGRLDQDHPHPHPWIVGQRIALQPVPWIEVGGTHLYAFGGEGAPDFPASQIVKEFFGYRKDVFLSNYANHSFTWDARVRLWRVAEVYVEHYLEDCCAHIVPEASAGVLSGQDSSVLAGVRRPRLFSQRDDLAVEYAHLTRIAYLSSDVTSEWSHRGRITGHPLGSHGDGVYALYRYLGDGGTVLGGALWLERRGVPPDWTSVPEWRVGGRLDARLPLRPGRVGRVDARLRGAVERVIAVEHEEGSDRTAWLLEAGIECAF
jgi:hypothetical protein